MTAPTSAASSRRDFLKVSAAAAATAATYLGSVPFVHAAGSDTLRVGLIGCGGRGTGAAEQCVNAGPNVQLIALADLFPDHLQRCKAQLQKDLHDKYSIKDEYCFTGWNAYQQLLDLKEIDLVLLATPPGFRPLHFKAAIAAGKHVFAEKPVAVDVPGALAVEKACEEAKAKGLAVVSGLCWRYHEPKRETFKRIHDGGVGDIVALQCSYNTGTLWHKPRQPEWSDMEWQVRNWLYFTWLSGDHNVEQHIHSLDKMAWAMRDEYPVTAVGLGGRQVRTGPEFGHIFDHHSVVYQFKNGVKLFANCRQQEGCAQEVDDFIFGTKGTCDVMKHTIKGEKPWKCEAAGKDKDMYQQEHNELVASIRAGTPINNGNYMVKSTLMAIMGRMATYTGQVITWDKLLNSKEDLTPPKYEFGPLPTPAVARPGVTKFV
jgi:myo-inositol 2-dehydrogenase/D-chiro-inositol 1-dehydrogenase